MFPAKKHKGKRIFSVIYVPDQERDPKSYSMSYARGHALLVLGVLLVVHALGGILAYVEIFRFDKRVEDLRQENKDLKAQNKRIEQIAQEFQQIRQTDAKIRKAFGGPLGLGGTMSSPVEVGANPIQYPEPSDFPASPRESETASSMNPSEGFYFLSKRDNPPSAPESLPTLLPVNGFMTTRFGQGGSFAGRSHYGIDIAARMGSPIFAAGTGVVVLADWTPDFGNLIVISHGGGLVTYYGHSMKLLVEQGTVVRKGQTVALLGSSGISSAPHLHFEIWKDGRAVDPETFLFSVQKRKEGPE